MALDPITMAPTDEPGDCPNCDGDGESSPGWECESCAGTGFAGPERCDGCGEPVGECTCDDEEE